MKQTLSLLYLIIAVLLTGCAGSDGTKEAAGRPQDIQFDQTMREADSLRLPHRSRQIRDGSEC